jgi:hypothetical protein
MVHFVDGSNWAPAIPASTEGRAARHCGAKPDNDSEGRVAAVTKTLREMGGDSTVLAVHSYGADHRPSSEDRNFQ